MESRSARNESVRTLEITQKFENDDSQNLNSDSDSAQGLPGDDKRTPASTTTVITTTTITETSLRGSTIPEDTNDIVILRKDPATKSKLNRIAYAKLHHASSPTRNSLDTLKEKYEPNVPPVLSVEQDYLIRKNYPDPNRPASVQEELLKSNNSKLPVAKRSSVKSQIFLPLNKQPEKHKLRYSLALDKKSKAKDENSNELYRRKSSVSSGEFITVVTRSDSGGSVDKFEKELNLFTMDTKPKEKKRSNSFRKIFSGKMFTKDKKKNDEDKNKHHFKENTANTDNIQNETNAFSRQAKYRHTTTDIGNKPKEKVISRNDSKPSNLNETYDPEIEKRYARKHVEVFNHIKQNFENQNPYATEYVQVNKQLNSPGPTNFMKIPNVQKYIDTSSSASTLESERDVANKQQYFFQNENENYNKSMFNRFEDTFRDTSRDTPPRAQELRQDLRLVNPKALIPINSERPLPNPYQNSGSSTLDKPSAANSRTVDYQYKHNEPNDLKTSNLVETYGTVLDSIDQSQKRNNSMQRNPTLKNEDRREPSKIPKSPSFEPTKLKLPPNREIVPLSPRVKSPILRESVSTEKIIATELLKPSRSPSPVKKQYMPFSSSNQKLETREYTDSRGNEINLISFDSSNLLSGKPPISRIPSRKSPETYSPISDSGTRQRIVQQSPNFDDRRLSQTSPPMEYRDHTSTRYRSSQISPATENQAKFLTNAVVHVNSSNSRTPTPNSLLYNRSASPARPHSARSSTPVDLRTPSTKSQSPQKEDMRKSVEAYYWKEIKKLKEQENFDLYYYQMMPNGYAEEPISIRRSRSSSPATRNTRRSLSLPRDPKPSNINAKPQDPHGRYQPDAIPEGRAVMNRGNIMVEQNYYQQHFTRNTPERRTIDSVPRNDGYGSIYRPIFKRGSLTTPTADMMDQQNKKVSFSGSRTNPQNYQPWPTKNGFMQNPPQRRIESNRLNSLDDDVFLPNVAQTSRLVVDGKEIYGYTTKPSNVQYDQHQQPGVNNNYYLRQNLSPHNQNGLYAPLPNRQYPQAMPRTPLYEREMNIRYRQVVPQNVPNTYSLDAAVRPPFGMTRHGSVQLQEPVYIQKQTVTRQVYDNTQMPNMRQCRQQQMPAENPAYGLQKREIIMNDEIFGQFGGYMPPDANESMYVRHQNSMYSTKHSVAEPVYGYGTSGAQQVSVNNKVCDMYGQIHDRDSPSATSSNQIKNTGVILGQLQKSPSVVRQSYSKLPNEQFVRNSRLTASANDVHKRCPKVDPRYRSDSVYENARNPSEEYGAPTRPLPPVPNNRKLIVRNNYSKSETESASNVSEVQRANNGNAKSNKRSFFRK